MVPKFSPSFKENTIPLFPYKKITSKFVKKSFFSQFFCERKGPKIFEDQIKLVLNKGKNLNGSATPVPTDREFHKAFYFLFVD